MIKNELTTTGTVKYYKMERRSVRSGYHGNNISGYQQSFLTETTICSVQRWGKSLDYRFVPDCNHARESIHVNLLFTFFTYHFCRTTVCWDLKILLPWQHDVTTSPLCCSFRNWPLIWNSVKRLKTTSERHHDCNKCKFLDARRNGCMRLRTLSILFTATKSALNEVKSFP